MPLNNSQATFLLLPLELRLQIYECIFLSKEQILPHRKHNDLRYLVEPPIPTSILRTCKQIHQEASPILYSKNTFIITYPMEILKWLQKIGRANMQLLEKIHIQAEVENRRRPALKDERADWYTLLDLLAREATGLRHVEVCWHLPFSAGGYGWDVRFVRELAKIQGLQSVVLDGWYGMHWPGYLTKTMGVEVVEKPHLENCMGSFSRFKQGTKDLYP